MILLSFQKKIQEKVLKNRQPKILDHFLSENSIFQNSVNSQILT